MTSLSTKVDTVQPDFSIDYQTKILFIGSCFVDHIGRKMEKYKFDVCLNPFGVVYNPISIANSIHFLLEKKQFRESDLSFYNELWFSYSHFSGFSDVSSEKCLEKINQTYLPACNFICKAEVIFITLGSSWTFKLKSSGIIIANCHKLPSSNFDRVFLSVEESVIALKKSIDEIRKVNPSAKIVFTVSPIRHMKDGAVENQRSKAALIIAIARLEKEYKNLYYFPAYEIVMDELRDYRFYAEDMMHISDIAIDLIWERFSASFINDPSRALLSEIEKLNAGINHRPMHTKTTAYKEFLLLLIQKAEQLSKQNPFLDLSREIEYLSSQLDS